MSPATYAVINFPMLYDGMDRMEMPAIASNGQNRHKGFAPLRRLWLETEVVYDGNGFSLRSQRGNQLNFRQF